MVRKRKAPERTTAELPPGGEGRFSYDGLDRVMHEKARLSILASLATHVEGLLFNDLRQLCSLTDGNLSRHLSVLSESGLVEIWKGTKGQRQQTMYRLSAHGRRRFAEYIGVLEKVVADAQSETQSETTPDTSAQDLSGGWAPA